MPDQPMMKVVNGVSMPMTEVEIAEHKALQEAWERDGPIRQLTAQPAADAALANPDLMRLWGEIHALWDDIEQTLMMAFYSLTDDDFATSRTIFFSQKGHASRREMVSDLARHRFRGNDAALNPLTTALKRVRARADARNNLFHGQWGWRVGGSIEATEPVRFVVEAQLSPVPKLYGMSELQSVRLDMRSTLEALREAIEPHVDAKLEFDRANFFSRRRLD